MAPTLHQTALHLSHLVVSQFLLIWFVALAFVLFCGLIATDERAGTRNSIWPSPLAKQAAGIGFAVFLLAFALLTFFKERLADFDNDVLWSILLLLVLFCGLLLSNRRHPIYARAAGGEAEGLGGGLPRLQGAKDWAAGIALAIVLAGYLAVIFYKQDFAWYDDEVFTDFSVQGKNFAPAIWPDQGRFFPLEVQEFNYLSWITRSPAGFHSFALAEILLLLAVLWIVLREFRVWQRALLLVTLMLTPSFLISYMGLIYPERNVLFWLAILVLCLLGHEKNRGAGCFLGCLVATHVALYHKEPVAVLVVAFAASRILLEWRARRTDSFSWRGFAKTNALPLSLFGVTAIFAGLFVLALFPQADGTYVEARRLPVETVLWAYVQTDWLLIALLVVSGVRVARALLLHRKLDSLWDPLATGGLAYFAAVFALGLYSGYYPAPVDLIAVLYLGRIGIKWAAKPWRPRAAIVAAAYLILVAHNTAYSAFRVIETKSMIGEKAQLADYVLNHSGSAGQTELYFPFASKFHLMELSAYLKYRGFQLEGQRVLSTAMGPRVVVEGRGDYPLGRCVSYRIYVCKHVDSASENAWIVVLPDDDVSMAEVEKLARGMQLEFSAQSCEGCSGENRWIERLHAISQEYWNTPLPGHWLKLQVFKRGARRAE